METKRFDELSKGAGRNFSLEMLSEVVGTKVNVDISYSSETDDGAEYIDIDIYPHKADEFGMFKTPIATIRLNGGDGSWEIRLYRLKHVVEIISHYYDEEAG